MLWSGVAIGVEPAMRLDGGVRHATGVLVTGMLAEGRWIVADIPVSRRRSAKLGLNGRASQEPAPLVRQWPALWSFLVAERWEDGEARTTGTVTLFCEQGKLKACFNDRDAGEIGFATVESGGTLLDALEELLAADRVDWRRPRPNARARK